MKNFYTSKSGDGLRVSFVRLLLVQLIYVLVPNLSWAQAPAWSAAIGTNRQPFGTSITQAIATDASGNVFVTGYFTGQVAFGNLMLNSVGGSDMFVAKYLPTTATWAWAQSGGGILADQSNGIAVSGTNVYVTGGITNDLTDTNAVRFGSTGIVPRSIAQAGASATSNLDLFVAKYTDNGTSATVNWTQAGGGTSADQGNGIAISGTNVYVTGSITNTTADANTVRFGGTGTTAGTITQNGASSSSAADLLVAKYTDNGTSAAVGWTQVGGGTSADQGNGIAVNGTNVYVCGTINNNNFDSRQVRFGGAGTTAGTVVQNGASSLAGNDLVVAKYVDNGGSASLRWTQVGGGTSADQGSGIAVSGTNVYVSGTVNNNGSDSRQVRFGGTGTTAGTVAQNGAGASSTASNDLVVAKYTDNGTTATVNWTQIGGGTGADQGNGIAVSGTNVYVTGSITNTTADANTVRFGATGTAVGTIVQNGAGSTASSDVVVAKYTDNGTSATVNWTQVGGGIGVDQGNAVAVSGTTVYVGSIVRDFDASFGTAPLLVSGNYSARAVLGQLNTAAGSWQALAAVFNGGFNGLRGIVTNANGDIFVTGTFNGQLVLGNTVLNSAGGADVFVAKFAPATGTWAWAQSGGGTDLDQTFGIAINGTSVYITGSITNNFADDNTVRFGGTGGTAPGTVVQRGASTVVGTDLLVAKYTDNGNSVSLAWTQVGGGTGFDSGNGIAVSGPNVYVTGNIQNNTRDGNLVRFGGSGPTAGTVVQAGTSTQQAVSDFLLVKYVDNGTSATVGWTQVGGGDAYDIGSAVAVNGTNVYVTGIVSNSPSDSQHVRFGGSGLTAGTVVQTGTSNSVIPDDILVAKYIDNGTSATLGWTQVGGGSSADYGRAIAVSGPNVYVTGSITNNITNGLQVRFGGSGLTAGTVAQAGTSVVTTDDIVVAKYTDNGTSATLGWTQVGGGSSMDYGYGIAASGSNVYVTGTIINDATDANQVRFGGSGLTAGTAVQIGASSAQNSDMLVAKYSDNGPTATLDWTQVGGSARGDAGISIALNGAGIYVAGAISAPATFGSFSLSAPSEDAVGVIAMLNTSAIVLNTTKGHAPAKMVLFPNPTHRSATLDGAKPGSSVEVRDVVGRLVATATTDLTGRATLTLPAELVAGVYMVRCGESVSRLSIE